MRMTQGVVSNLVNRYRAVLKKCHLLNAFGTLAVVTLLCGGVGVAQAAITTDNASLTVDSGKSETLDGGKLYKVTGTNRDSVNITGGTLVMQAGSALNLNVSGGVVVQNNGTLEMKGADITGSTFDATTRWTNGPTMAIGTATSSGNVLISSGENFIEAEVTVNTHGSLTVNEGAHLGFAKNEDHRSADFTMAGGTVLIKGIMDTSILHINSGSLSVEGKGHLETDAVDVKGGTVTADKLIVVGDGSSLAPRETPGIVVDSIMNVTGGEVKVNTLEVFTKTDPENVPLKQQDAAELTITGGALNVAGNATITKGDQTSGTQGSNAKIVVDGGTFHVKGDLTSSDGGIFEQKSGNTFVDGTISLDQSLKTVLTGGNLNVGALNFNQDADKTALTLDSTTPGSTLFIVGTKAGSEDGTEADWVISNVAKIDINTGGTLNLGSADPAATRKDNRGVYNGTITLDGGAAATNATLNVRNGEFRVNKIAMGGTVGGAISISNGGTLRLDTEKSFEGFLGTSGKGTLTVDGGGSRLRFAGGATLKTSDLTGTSTAGKIALVSGGMLKMGDDKSLIFKDTADQTLSTNGQVKTFNLEVKTHDAKGNLALNSGWLVVNGNTDNTNGGIIADTITVNGSSSQLRLGSPDFDDSEGRAGGSLDANVTVTRGRLGVDGGQWTMASGKTLDISGTGLMTVNSKAALDVTGTMKINGTGRSDAMVTVSGGGKLTAADMKLTGASRGAVLVQGGGELAVDKLNIAGAKNVGSINVQALGSMTGKTASNFLTQNAAGDFAVNTASGGTGLEGGFTGSAGFLVLDGTATYTQAQLEAASDKLGITVGYSDGTFIGEVKITGDKSIMAQNNEVTLTDAKTLTGTVVAKTLKASGSATSVTVGNAGRGSLTVLGTGGTDSVIKNANGAAVETITLGAGGSLGLGSAAFAEKQQGGSVGTIAMTGNSAQVLVQTGNFTAKAVDMAGASGTLTVNAGGSLITEKLTARAGDAITVGTPDSAGTLIAKDVKMAGATLYMDPSWATGGVHAGSYGSRAALKFSGDKVDGLLTVGNASQLTLGTDNVAWLSENLDKSQQWGTGITAALGIYSQQKLDATLGGILVNSKASGASAEVHKATFASKSLLAVNALAGMQASGGALVAGNATDVLTVAADAKLMIVGGNDKDVVKVVSGFNASASGSSIDASSWTGGNLLTDTSMMQATVKDTDVNTGYTVTLDRTGIAENVFPMLSDGGTKLVNALFDQNKRDVNSPDAGIRFLSRAVGDQGGVYVKDATDTARVIEGAARLGASAGVSQATLGAVSAATTAVMNRTSLANPLTGTKTAAVVSDPETHSWNTESGANAGDSKAGSTALWIMPLYQSNNSWGMKAGNFKTGLSSDLFGVALGADYGISDAFRIGASFNIGGGHAQSKGDFYKTNNDFNFWGVSIYGGYAANNLALMADVGYTGVYNKADQELPSSMAMGDMKSDIESSAITAGLRGEYKIPTDVMDFTPYVGVRYTGITTEDYKAKADGGTVFKNNTDLQNVWTFPIGVSLSKDVETSGGWTVKPQLDLGIIAAAGDLEVRNSAKVAGLATSADMKTQVVDGITFDGGLGLNVAKDNVSFGVSYNLQMSEHRTGHGVNAIFRYEF